MPHLDHDGWKRLERELEKLRTIAKEEEAAYERWQKLRWEMVNLQDDVHCLWDRLDEQAKAASH